MRPKASTRFLDNEQEFLWFCLTCRETGIPASVRLKLTDEVMAMEIDNAVTLRLLHFDKEQKSIDRKMLAYEVCTMAFGPGDSGSAAEGEVTYE